jgi:hypothetical protein
MFAIPATVGIMVDIGRLPKGQHITIARLTGSAYRLTYSPRPDDGDPVAELHAITTVPCPLGVAAGVAAVSDHGPAEHDLLVRAGADLAVAAEHEREVQEWEARRGRR